MVTDEQIDEIVDLLRDILAETRRMANAMEAPLVPGGIRELVSEEELDKMIDDVFRDIKDDDL